MEKHTILTVLCKCRPNHIDTVYLEIKLFKPFELHKKCCITKVIMQMKVDSCTDLVVLWVGVYDNDDHYHSNVWDSDTMVVCVGA